jgi:Na+-transporting methylmalonyl-CoA/oxaloacetate decarboxylase gamma subunit
MEEIGVVGCNLIAEIAGGGFGLTFLVMAILALIAWATGLIIRKAKREHEKDSTVGKG